jgi:hypothetical protein
MNISFGEHTFDGKGHVSIAMTKTYDNGFVEYGVFVMPEDTLEWRAAEYDIDPNDLDTLMDVVLAEQFLEVPPGETTPPLFTADTIEEARKIHLARCAQAKLRHRISTRAKGHPIAELKPKMLMDPEALHLKRRIVRQRRSQFKNLGTGPEKRLSQLRAMLDQHQEVPSAELHD